MLDVFDFIVDKGGDPKKVRESQRRRNAPEEDVDEVINLYEDARRTKYAASQAKQRINALQKEIGQKKKVGEFLWISSPRKLMFIRKSGQRKCG